jgi:hypothetical protein
LENSKKFDVKFAKDSILLNVLPIKDLIEARKAIENFYLSNSSII